MITEKEAIEWWNEVKTIAYGCDDFLLTGKELGFVKKAAIDILKEALEKTKAINDECNWAKAIDILRKSIRYAIEETENNERLL